MKENAFASGKHSHKGAHFEDAEKAKLLREKNQAKKLKRQTGKTAGNPPVEASVPEEPAKKEQAKGKQK